jgi:basic amino acid/polyamine antiporter, APA family
VKESTITSAESGAGLARRLGLFDVTMIVMGGIIGSGIFINPYVVAQQVHTPFLILGVWAAGGLIALAGAFVYAELASRRPEVGGQYAYMREAFHPSVAFIYGWTLLLVTQTGGMAAVAVTFARYLVELTGISISEGLVATLALASLTVINCFGVRSGATVQDVFMVLKVLAIAVLIGAGLVGAGFAPGREAAQTSGLLDRPISGDLFTGVGAAMVPVLFAYGGWQTASFVAGEIRDPRRTLTRALIIGVLGVIVLYLGVNFVCVHVLGPAGLAATTTPASQVMRIRFGETGARLIATGIAISTAGFLSQGMLTAPRVYYAMAEDGLFFKSVGWLHPRTRVPVVAVALQGIAAIVIALSGRYEQILNYVVSVDFIFFGLTATCVFALRRRDGFAVADNKSATRRSTYNIPGHPFTTWFFIAACWLVVLATIYKYPANSAIGLAIMLAGAPAYLLWRRRV